ncbi:MAG: hypothetical protein M1839_000265 [Geoglossum umbratile]|nr:MAG: hypothetical protein M1839_000265 [Geoglossum umbratile]
MARLRGEHGESGDEFPDVSVIISRFYQDKLSKSTNELDRTHNEDSAPRPRTPAKVPAAQYPLRIDGRSPAETGTSEDSLGEDGPFLLKFSPPKSKIAKGSPSKQSRVSPSSRPNKNPTRGQREIPKYWNGGHGGKAPRSGRQPKSQPIIGSSLEESKAVHTPGKTKHDRITLGAKKLFKERKHDLARDFLQDLDNEVSGGQIASITEPTGGIKLIWSKKLTTTAGRANWKREKITAPTVDQTLQSSGGQSASYRHIASIELSEKVIDNEDRLVNAISHEYCHLANYMISGVLDHPHGESFKKWAKICTRAFSHRGVEVTTKHSYDIDYKYIWECTGCGVHFKRHSKSLDPTRHTCSSCKSKIVQIQPTPRNGALSEYQLFVKEKFGEVKKANPGSPQKEIMGLLGAAYKKERRIGVADGMAAGEVELPSYAGRAGREGDLDCLAGALGGLDLRDP